MKNYILMNKKTISMKNYNINDLILKKNYNMHIELYNKNNNKLEDFVLMIYLWYFVYLVLRRFDFLDL